MSRSSSECAQVEYRAMSWMSVSRGGEGGAASRQRRSEVEVDDDDEDFVRRVGR